MPTIALIAAIDENGLIGHANALPWPRLEADMRHFRRTTLGHPIVMGRKTFESLGSRPLPGRTNIILTRDANFSHPGCEAINRPAEILGRRDEIIFIIGGRSVYQAFLPYANRLDLTYVGAKFKGDICFPEIDWSNWKLKSETRLPASAANPYPLRFTVWERL